MVIKHDLKRLFLSYDKEAQEFTAVNKLGKDKPFDKVQMFSIGIFISQIERNQFMHKSVIAKLNRLANLKK
jgi:hypothetical protein